MEKLLKAIQNLSEKMNDKLRKLEQFKINNLGKLDPKIAIMEGKKIRLIKIEVDSFLNLQLILKISFVDINAYTYHWKRIISSLT